MNSTPRVETAEISDAELDNVSGGLSVNAVLGLSGSEDDGAAAGETIEGAPTEDEAPAAEADAETTEAPA